MIEEADQRQSLKTMYFSSIIHRLAIWFEGASCFTHSFNRVAQRTSETPRTSRAARLNCYFDGTQSLRQLETRVLRNDLQLTTCVAMDYHQIYIPCG